MPDYIQDPNDPKKQIPGNPPKNQYDRVATVGAFSMSKAPTYIHVVSNVAGGLGFYFGNSASFSEIAIAEGGALAGGFTASSAYVPFDTLAAGQYHLNPIAVSGSDADAAKIIYVYQGGQDGAGRP